ncbi:hypothetical protein [Halobacterium salinarum]|uniref:hypothetical protein n=1 Tax=Halobacterium salinarum TaxID=2242 RepID=UPI0025545C46|nr:hypothetical protein [Halobacterium salinarum]MDL0127627.1 hypothetical protein [Halobacterium salinarum]
MGRTNPTYRDTLRHMEDNWQPYRRALRRRDQDRFDALWGAARGYADAAGYLSHSDPSIAMLFSICLAQQRHIDQLLEAIEHDRFTNPDTETAKDADC